MQELHGANSCSHIHVRLPLLRIHAPAALAHPCASTGAKLDPVRLCLTGKQKRATPKSGPFLFAIWWSLAGSNR